MHRGNRHQTIKKGAINYPARYNRQLICLILPCAERAPSEARHNRSSIAITGLWLIRRSPREKGGFLERARERGRRLRGIYAGYEGATEEGSYARSWTGPDAGRRAHSFGSGNRLTDCQSSVKELTKEREREGGEDASFSWLQRSFLTLRFSSIFLFSSSVSG